MTILRVTAECPICPWTFSDLISDDMEPLELIRKSESTIDDCLLEHTKSHESIKVFLSEAGAVPGKANNKFRGTYNLMYKEEII